MDVGGLSGRITEFALSLSLSMMPSRSVRETVTDDERKAFEEEKNVDQEMYIESILQRIIYIRSAFRTDSGRSSSECSSTVRRMDSSRKYN